MLRLEWSRNTGPPVRVHSGSQALTGYSRRWHTTKYSIQAPYVFDTIIRSSKAQHGPMQITTVDDERNRRSVRIRMQTVESAAEKPCQQHAIE